MIKHIQRNELFLFATGWIVVMAALLPYFILGDNIVVYYHDQLDGEVLAYMLHAKYLFTGIEAYPELMNGISENGMFPPAPLLVLLYKFLSPLAAFVYNQIFCMLAAYTGMYLCLKKVVENDKIAVFCGILFAYLPLFSVYGLCQYGQPLLIYAFYLLYSNRHKILALVIVIMYGLLSSLVLVGYALLGILGLYLLWLFYKRQLQKHSWLIVSWMCLLCCYIITNYKLILQIFGIGTQRPSHKEAVVRYGQNVIDSFNTIFYKGTLHTPTHQQIIVIFTLIIFLVGIFVYRKLETRLRMVFNMLSVGLLFNVFCAVFYAFYQSALIANFRNQVGGVIKEFQVERIYWLTVFVWYFILGLDLYLIWEWIKSCVRSKKRLCMVIGGVCLSSLVFASAAIVYYYSDFNKNIHRLRQGEAYEQITWKDFYAPEIYAQIDDFIGREKSSYRTLSFGLYPAAALYNGFYCLDGYSNNYDLTYMYAFRDIIKGELEKDESLRKYYDEWGCRCYVLSAEIGINNYMIAKNSRVLAEGLALDTAAAKKLGAQYLFSAVKIPNAQELGLTLLREEPFETSDSYYAVYLYGL